METIALNGITNQGAEMANLGYFPGVLAAMWAEIAVREQQPDQSVKVFWQLKELLGMGF